MFIELSTGIYFQSPHLLQQASNGAAARTRKPRTHRVPASCKVYTPPGLAMAMVKALGSDGSEKWLEPCVGGGALLHALARSGVGQAQITGIDLEADAGPNDRLAMVQRGVEFLSWSMSTANRFNKIVANPPYVAIERLQQSIRRAACQIQTRDGLKVTAVGNTWYAFLCAAINLLQPSGSLCFLLPAAWDFANYAAPLRRSICRYFESVDIYRSKTPLFRAAGIQDGAVILVARKLRAISDVSFCSESTSASRTEYETPDLLIQGLTGSTGEQRPAIKPPENAIPGSCHLAKVVETEKLGNLMSIRLGGVTGDANYFLLSDEERRGLGLPIASLRPVVTRAKHLTSAAITKGQWEELRHSGERVWLFDPAPGIAEHPAVRRYLRKGREHGACNISSHKISGRCPWYRTPLPSQIDGFLSGMSRLGPWISLRRMARLGATNTLYTVCFSSRRALNERAAIALSLLTSQVAEQFDRVGRWYADGLLKFEPGDLCDIRIVLPSGTAGAYKKYRECIAALMSGGHPNAQHIADAWQGA